MTRITREQAEKLATSRAQFRINLKYLINMGVFAKRGQGSEIILTKTGGKVLGTRGRGNKLFYRTYEY